MPRLLPYTVAKGVIKDRVSMAKHMKKTAREAVAIAARLQKQRWRQEKVVAAAQSKLRSDMLHESAAVKRAELAVNRAKKIDLENKVLFKMAAETSPKRKPK